VKRTDGDFIYFGDPECDILAHALHDGQEEDEFSVRPSGSPFCVTLTVRRLVGGRPAGTELQLSRSMVAAVSGDDLRAYTHHVIDEAFASLVRRSA
jgi:hypothetical protein